MALLDDSMENLKRKAALFILGVMSLGSIFATAVHSFEAKTHPVSVVIPPLSAIICLSLFLYLIKHPTAVERVIKINLAWSSFILLFPEYFFVVEAVLNPEKRLVDILPPITSGLFILTTSMIVFLRPHRFIRTAIALWFFLAAPIVIYLIIHPNELQTPRGIDLMITLVPAMGINLALIQFYLQLQNVVNRLNVERFYWKEISEKDALTKVFNRHAGEKVLQSLISQPEPKFGLILCDVDYFKHVNDKYGHLAGDRVLQAIAQCLQTHIRKQDILVRWGGEEFLIVVPDVDRSEIEQLAQRLRSRIANQQIPDVGQVTASFGVSILDSQKNLRQLFDRADQALYRAKELGRNRVVLESEAAKTLHHQLPTNGNNAP